MKLLPLVKSPLTLSSTQIFPLYKSISLATRDNPRPIPLDPISFLSFSLKISFFLISLIPVPLSLNSILTKGIFFSLILEMAISIFLILLLL
jgi:hypothetical protein